MNKITPLLFLSCLTACTMAPELSLPVVPAPNTWKESDAKTDNSVMDAGWWQGFGSEALPGLVRQAEQANPDLAAARARIEQARAASEISGATFWPSLQGSGQFQRDYNSRPSAGQDSAKNSYSVGLQASYELDLFGKNRAGVDAADWREKASVFDHRALKISTAAQAAQLYFNWLALVERVRLSKENLGNARQVLETLQVRRHNGALSDLEVAQQENFVGSSSATFAQLQQQETAARNALAIWLGQTPHDFQTPAEDLSRLQAPVVPVAMPSVWLTRRPDVASAEAALRAANADIGAARAAFFPSLSLDATTALAANPASAPAALLSSLAASALAPIFSGGALEGKLHQATAAQTELAAAYHKTVLAAYAEAENALRAVTRQGERLAALEQAAQAARLAYAKSRVRFQTGAIDNVTMLDAQRSMLQADDALAQGRADHLSATVDLYRAMGGEPQPLADNMDAGR